MKRMTRHGFRMEVTGFDFHAGEGDVILFAIVPEGFEDMRSAGNFDEEDWQ